MGVNAHVKQSMSQGVGEALDHCFENLLLNSLLGHLFVYFILFIAVVYLISVSIKQFLFHLKVSI